MQVYAIVCNCNQLYTYIISRVPMEQTEQTKPSKKKTQSTASSPGGSHLLQLSSDHQICWSHGRHGRHGQSVADRKISLNISLFRRVFRIGLHVRRTRLTSSASKSKSALLVTPIFTYRYLQLLHSHGEVSKDSDQPKLSAQSHSAHAHWNLAFWLVQLP